MPPFEEYAKEIAGIWDSRWLSNYGERYNKLKSELEEYLGVPHMCLFANGHLALESAIAAFGLEGEVITTPFTFASTTHAIVRNGLTPVFCDIDPQTYCIDPGKIEDLITDSTSAIVGVHVYGGVCAVEEIADIAKRHNLKVIYDGAHAFGVRKNGIGIGDYGDATMFSFHATKVFHTIEGGGIAFSDESIGEKLRRLQNFGYADDDAVPVAGGNAKMNEFQAAMGLCNLRHIDEMIEGRRIVVERYRERLEGVKGLRLRAPQPDATENYAYYPVVFDSSVFKGGRDAILEALGKRGINARKYFYPLTCDFECYRGKYEGDVPIARAIAAHVLALPLYEGLPLEDVDRVCDIIIEHAND